MGRLQPYRKALHLTGSCHVTFRLFVSFISCHESTNRNVALETRVVPPHPLRHLIFFVSRRFFLALSRIKSTSPTRHPLIFSHANPSKVKTKTIETEAHYSKLVLCKLYSRSQLTFHTFRLHSYHYLSILLDPKPKPHTPHHTQKKPKKQNQHFAHFRISLHFLLAHSHLPPPHHQLSISFSSRLFLSCVSPLLTIFRSQQLIPPLLSFRSPPLT